MDKRRESAAVPTVAGDIERDSNAPHQAMIVPLLGRFRSEFPSMKIELIANDANLDLVGESVDLAIRLAPSVGANVVASKLFNTRYHVVAAPSWLAIHPLDLPQDLANHQVLRLNSPGFRDRWLFQWQDETALTVPIDGDILVSSPLALREAAVDGLGPALLPDWLVEGHLRDGRLVDCFPTARVTATDFATGAWLIYPSRAYLPNKVRVTIDFLRLSLARPV